MGLAEISDSFFKPAVRDIVPYEPGKPVEEVQRELGLERVVKLASNEGPFGPFPEALDALAEAAPELNRYPDGGGYRLRGALAERHGVRFEEIALGAGADGVVDCLAQVSLDPGDDVVLGWPSFPSYVITARKLGATATTVPLRDGRYDLDALLGAITDRTKLVYVCHPNNPTGTTNTRAELDDYFERVPDHVLTVLDQAYFEYVDDPDYPDGVEAYLKRGRRVVVLRTFSKIFGLAGLRVGYGVAPAEVVTAVGKVRRAFDITSPAQVAALASLSAPGAGGRARAPPPHQRRGPPGDRGGAPRARLRPSRPRRGELRLRGSRRGFAPAVRAPAPGGRDRAPDRRLRRARWDQGDGGHAGREQGLRRGARAGARAHRVLAAGPSSDG